eukprot:scaffold17359_cov57-Phaeocystis_antarctica.AAC.2
MASTPVNCSSSTSASCCCSSQLFDETAGAAPRPTGSSNIRARSVGGGVGAAGCVAGAPNGAARVGGGACVAPVFPGSGPESSEEQEGWHEYPEEVALAEEEVALLALNCPPNRSANAAAQWKPGGIPAGDEFKRSGQLLAEAVGAIEGAGGAAGAAPKPIGSSNIWARSAGSGGGAVGGAVSAADGRVGVAGSGAWTRPGTAVVMGAEVRHGAEAGTQARIPPRPLSGSFVNPALYLAFSASGSAFQRWPGVWQGAGQRAREKGIRREVTGWGRGTGRGNMGLGTGGMGAGKGAVMAELKGHG